MTRAAATSSRRSRCRPADPRLDKLFPVHRIYCVGRNYAEHAIEMGHDPNREAPFFFQKNPDTLVPDGGVSRIRARPRTCITSWRWWWRCNRAAATSPSERRWSMFRLCRRPRHDAARPAGRGQEGSAARGKSARRSSMPRPARRSSRPPRSAIRRRAPCGSRSTASAARQGDLSQTHLEGAGDDRLPLRPVRAQARRSHLSRHAGRRRP